MSDDKRAPEFIAYSVKDRGEGKDAAWNRIGAAWPHRDGQGYDLALDAMPVDGRVTLREQRREAFKEQRTSNGSAEREPSRGR